MSDSFETLCQAVIASGWSSLRPAAFVKGDLELVFDTSTYIEVYRDAHRVAECRVATASEVTVFLSSLSPAGDKTA